MSIRRFRFLLAGLVGLLLVSCGVASHTASYYTSSNKATREVLSEGMVCYTIKDSLFGAPQSISILEFNPSKYTFKLLSHNGMAKTDKMAEELGAVAAINGTFYNMRKGNSVCYMQIDGVVADTTVGNDMQRRATGAVLIKKGKLSTIPWNKELENQYKATAVNSDGVSVMAAMPVLIDNGKAVEMELYKGFSNKRHPRSVVFVTNEGLVCLMVIDGRHKGNAEGMTLDEVQQFLLSINNGKGCRSAVNLDGGGSSTLWTAKEGVINYPSDNSKFDHKGTRKVANSIIVMAK
ncbi:MAG: phosphodiester glycosidase family protein [Bacteroidales bacterium]|nr:phosphodiester glycosidase family protein [Bacteroidales bacterium]